MSVPGEIKFGILGPVEIYDARNLCVRPSSPLQRNLLVTLIVKGGVIVPNDTLFYELWGDHAPGKAANALQAHITRLRRLLRESEPDRTGPGRIITGTSGYALQVAPAETDAWHFTSLTAEAKRIAGQFPAHAVELLRAALGLWRGTVLDGETWGVLSANRLRQLEEERLVAMEALYDAALRADMHDQIVGELEAVCAECPFRERFYDQLMVALYRCGRQVEALSVYERARRILVKELGLEPVPALTQRMQQILSHSPALLNRRETEPVALSGGGRTAAVDGGVPAVAPPANPRPNHAPAPGAVPVVPMPRPQRSGGQSGPEEQSELVRLRVMVNELTGVVGQLLRRGSCPSCAQHGVGAHHGPGTHLAGQ